MNSAMMVIGPTKESVKEARSAVMDILKSGQDQATIQKALDIYNSICSVNNVSVNSCSFVNNPKKEGK